MSTHTLDSELMLRRASLRVTAQRRAVLHALALHPHVDVRSLKTLVHAEIGAVSKQALYDVVGALVGAGLVRRVGMPGSASLFELENGDHHHTVCRTCGELEDVGGVIAELPRLTSPTEKGFVVDETVVTFRGTCGSCREKTVGGAQTPSPMKENI